MSNRVGAPDAVLRVSPRGVWLVARLVLLLVATHSSPSAHELQIDQLRLWLNTDSNVLRGQLSFDPALTRDLDGPLPREEAEQRIVEFVTDNLTIVVDSVGCASTLAVRELYEEGGAVPGDIVMLECRYRGPPTSVGVSVSEPLRQLIVSVQARSGAWHSVLVPGGSRSPAFEFGATAPSKGWREGGAEVFAPAPVPSAQAPPSLSAEPRGSGGEGFEATPLWSTIGSYLRLGFVHILPHGWDHVLFVCGLVLGAGGRLRRLLLELSLFTVAHTLTLGLGALGWVVVPGGIVEPLIAFSIAAVAVENIWSVKNARLRLLVVLLFGLVHGQGFAGALAATGLPDDAFLWALVCFNLGVEAGQLVVAAALATPLFLLRRRSWYRRYLVLPPSLGIAAIGLYWGIERVLA